MFRSFSIILFLFSSFLYANENNRSIFDNPRYDSINLVTEVRGQVEYWSPGLSEDEGQFLLKYDTEGLNVLLTKFKLQMHDSDIATYEFFLSDTKNRLKAEHKKNQQGEAYAEGVRWSIHIGKLLAYLFDEDCLNNFKFEHTKRDFIGNLKITEEDNEIGYKSNPCFWHGEDCEDPNSMYEYGDRFTFETKFRQDKLFYTFDNLYWDSYASVGLFDISWAKPTFIGTYIIRELPVFFDAKYHSQGVSLDVGKKTQNHDFKAYFDWGADNTMDLTDNMEINDIINDAKLSMFMAGTSYDYTLQDFYTNDYFTIDISFGSYIRWIRMGREYTDFGLDGELNYGLNANVEFIF